MKQTLPFGCKVLEHKEFTTGKTDGLYRFSDRKKLGGFVIRQERNPGGDGYIEGFSAETIALRKEELAQFTAAGKQYGVRVVNYLEFIAKFDDRTPPQPWQIAQRINGSPLNELLASDETRFGSAYARVLQTGAKYLNDGFHESRPYAISDFLKPSQYIDTGDEVFMVDTNPPLWSETNGLDFNCSELALMTSAFNEEFPDELNAITNVFTALKEIHGKAQLPQLDQLRAAVTSNPKQVLEIANKLLHEKTI